MRGLGPITQLGYLTNELDEAATLWAKAMRVGPFTKMAGVTMPATMDGESVEIKIDLALAYLGDIQIELIQPLCDSPSPYRANKKAGLWGSHHTQFTVPNLDVAIAKGEDLGMEMACEIISGGARYIYMRSKAGWIELTTPNAALHPFFEGIKASCDNWGGQTVWNSF